jgi:hypothetical protein
VGKGYISSGTKKTVIQDSTGIVSQQPFVRQNHAKSFGINFHLSRMVAWSADNVCISLTAI